jgi:8-oxo-dGTP diphosphatase
MQPERYNIRVYGVCHDALGRVLLTDERRGGVVMTKFPGGGHELGEGLGDALKREFMEEAGAHIELLDLLYINDFLQISAFNPKDQLISIYYRVQLVGDLQVAVAEARHDFAAGDGDQQTFRWVTIDALDAADFRFPIDKLVVGLLKGGT